MQDIEIEETASREELPRAEDTNGGDESNENQGQNDAQVDNRDSSMYIFGLVPANGTRKGDEEVIRHVNCPSQLVGKLIGKGGETIQAIQNSTNTRIQIDQSVAGANEKRVGIFC